MTFFSSIGELLGKTGPDQHWARGDEVSGIFTTVTPSQLAKFNTLLSRITLIFMSKKNVLDVLTLVIGKLLGSSGPAGHRWASMGDEVFWIFTTVTPSQRARFNTPLPWITSTFILGEKITGLKFRLEYILK